MNRLHTPRRFPMTLAALALLAAPFGSGCGGDTPPANLPAPPPKIVDNVQYLQVPDDPAKFPVVSSPSELPTFDQAIHQAAGDLKQDANKDAADAKKEVRDAEGDVKKAVKDAEDDAKRRAKAVEEDARKAAEDALNNLLPAPK